MDYLLFAVCIIGGYLLNQFFKLKPPPLSPQKEPKKTVTVSPMPLTLVLEKHDDVFYIFDRTTNEFVSQANSLTELGQNLLKYKKIQKALVQDGTHGFWYVNGKFWGDFQ